MSNSPYTLVRDDSSSLLAPQTRMSVMQDGRRIGTVVRVGAGRWRVFDAGMGVEVTDPRAVYAGPDLAADAVLTARAASPALVVEEGLSAVERGILDLEGEWFRLPGSKEAAIRERFGITETRYYQVLNRLIDQGDALAYAPMVVGRLRRLRDTRQARRSSLRLVASL